MVLQNGKVADARNIASNAVTFLEGINFNTELAQNNSITDKSYTYASTDVFTDSNGYNDSVDTGNTTAIYSSTSQEYSCNFTDDASGDTTHDPDSVSNPSNAFDNDDSTNASESRTQGAYSLGKTFSSKFVAKMKIKCSITSSTEDGVGGDLTCIATLQSYDGSSWNDEKTLFDESENNAGQGATTSGSFDDIVELDKTVQGLRVKLDSNSGGSDYNNGKTNKRLWHTIEYGDLDNSIIELNSKTFSDITNASSLLLTAKNNGLGDVTYDVSSDGGSTYEKTGQNIREVVGLDGDNNQIKIKINLNKGSNGESPKVPGYAYQVWEN